MTSAAGEHPLRAWVDLRGKYIDNLRAGVGVHPNRPSGQMTPTRGLEELHFFGVALLNDVYERSN